MKRIALLMALVMTFAVLPVGVQACAGCHQLRAAMELETDPLARFAATTPPSITTSGILVSPAFIDNLGVVLASMDVPHTQLGFGNRYLIDDRDFLFDNFDTVFINCGWPLGDSTPIHLWEPGMGTPIMDPEVLNEFVYAGGVAYLSDLASRVLIEAFPSKEFTFGHQGGTFQSRVADTESPMQRLLRRRLDFIGIADNFNLFLPEDIVTGWSDDADVTVLVEGTFPGVHWPSWGGSEIVCEDGYHPIIFYFNYGEGRVFYSALHHHHGQAGAERYMFQQFVRLVFDGDGMVDDDDFAYEEYGYRLSEWAQLEVAAGDTVLAATVEIEEGESFIAIARDEDIYVILVCPEGYEFTNYDTEEDDILTGTAPEPSDDDEVLGATATADTVEETVVTSLGANGIHVAYARAGEWQVYLKNMGDSDVFTRLGLGFSTDLGGSNEDTPTRRQRFASTQHGIASTPISANDTVRITVSVVGRVATLNIDSRRRDELVNTAENGVITFDMGNIDATTVIISRVSMDRFAQAGLALEFLMNHGVVRVNATEVQELAARAGTSVTIDVSEGAPVPTASVVPAVTAVVEYDYDYEYLEEVEVALLTTIDEAPPAPAYLRFTIGSATFTSGGALIFGDAAPFIDTATDRTMVPIRAISESLGATVDWIDETRTVSITLGNLVAMIPVDAPLPGGMGTAVIVGDRTFVPVRYVSEVLGAEVRWDEFARAVYVYPA